MESLEKSHGRITAEQIAVHHLESNSNMLLEAEWLTTENQETA